MAYENTLMAELMVPRDAEVASRLQGFYEGIGWVIRSASDSPNLMYVNPEVQEGIPPTIAYWQTQNPDKTSKFHLHEEYEQPSLFARGLRLPYLQDLVEVCLVVPNDDDVHAIFERGGKILERHTHIMPRHHAGSQEFRFADPFNYSLRVTADPGWEIAPPASDKLERATTLEYDPDYVTILIDQQTGKGVPVITHDNMHAFEQAYSPDSRLAERLMNALLRYANISGGLSTYLLVDHTEKEELASAGAVGIRVESARNLLEQLKHGTFDIRHIGKKSLGLLELYCDKVIAAQPPEGTSS